MRFVILGCALIASQAIAQTDPMALPLNDAGEIVNLVGAQTDVLQEMSEKLSRIETIVTDTNEKTATREDVNCLLERLVSMRTNLAVPQVVATAPVVTSAPIVTSGPSVLSTGWTLQPGERIVAIDGVPVDEAPALRTVAPVQTGSPYQFDLDSRPFRKDLTVTDTRTGDRAVITATPFRTTLNEYPSGCYIDANGQRQCPDGYNPANVTSPANDSGRRRLFGRIFGRR